VRRGDCVRAGEGTMTAQQVNTHAPDRGEGSVTVAESVSSMAGAGRVVPISTGRVAGELCTGGAQLQVSQITGVHCSIRVADLSAATTRLVPTRAGDSSVGRDRRDLSASWRYSPAMPCIGTRRPCQALRSQKSLS